MILEGSQWKTKRSLLGFSRAFVPIVSENWKIYALYIKLLSDIKFNIIIIF